MPQTHFSARMNLKNTKISSHSGGGGGRVEGEKKKRRYLGDICNIYARNTYALARTRPGMLQGLVLVLVQARQKERPSKTPYHLLPPPSPLPSTIIAATSSFCNHTHNPPLSPPPPAPYIHLTRPAARIKKRPCKVNLEQVAYRLSFT